MYLNLLMYLNQFTNIPIILMSFLEDIFHVFFRIFSCFFGWLATSWMYVPTGFQISFAEKPCFCGISGLLTPTCDHTITCDPTFT